MAAGHSKDSEQATVIDMPAVAAEWTPEMRSMVELNRLVAARSVREGDAARGFAELIRATRSVPMRAPLASVVVRMALAANQATPAIAVIRQGLDETKGADRLGVMRAAPPAPTPLAASTSARPGQTRCNAFTESGFRVVSQTGRACTAVDRVEL